MINLMLETAVPIFRYYMASKLLTLVLQRAMG